MDRVSDRIGMNQLLGCSSKIMWTSEHLLFSLHSPHKKWEKNPWPPISLTKKMYSWDTTKGSCSPEEQYRFQKGYVYPKKRKQTFPTLIDSQTSRSRNHPLFRHGSLPQQPHLGHSRSVDPIRSARMFQPTSWPEPGPTKFSIFSIPLRCWFLRIFSPPLKLQISPSCTYTSPMWHAVQQDFCTIWRKGEAAYASASLEKSGSHLPPRYWYHAWLGSVIWYLGNSVDNWVGPWCLRNDGAPNNLHRRNGLAPANSGNKDEKCVMTRRGRSSPEILSRASSPSKAETWPPTGSNLLLFTTVFVCFMGLLLLPTAVQSCSRHALQCMC